MHDRSSAANSRLIKERERGKKRKYVRRMLQFFCRKYIFSRGRDEGGGGFFNMAIGCGTSNARYLFIGNVRDEKFNELAYILLFYIPYLFLFLIS